MVALTDFEKLMQSYQQQVEPTDFEQLLALYQAPENQKAADTKQVTDAATVAAPTNKVATTAAPINLTTADNLQKTVLGDQSKDTTSVYAPAGVVAGATNVTDTTKQNPLVDLYQTILGRTPTQQEIDSWNFGETVDPYELERFLGSARGEALTTMPTNTTAGKLAQQILGQKTTSKWSGEGYGSTEKNAYDMGTILASIGITDLKDFGKITKEVPAYDDEGNQAGTQKITTYGNIKTGQAVPNTYSERQTGSAWGGTFAGKGNTGYRVYFDDKGNPYFYTTGASSNDLFNLLADNPVLNLAANAAAAYFGGPEGVAALQAAQGKNMEDVAKSYIMTLAGQEFTKGLTDVNVDTNVFGETGVDIAKTVKDTLGATGADIATKAAGQYVASGGKADIGDLLINQGVGAATTAVLGEIPGFKDLNSTEQKFVAKIVSSTLNDGKLSPNEAVNAALAAGIDASKQTNIKALEGLTNSGRTGDDMGGSYDTTLGGLTANADGNETVTLPDGIQVAGPYKVDVSGVPLFKETVPADFKPPAGLNLVSDKDIQTIYNDDGTFKKEVFPPGAYQDYTLIPGKGVWVTKEDTLQNFDTSKFADDIALFNQSKGDLDKIAAETESKSDDAVADFLKSIGITSTSDLTDSKLSNSDILDLIGASKAGDSIDELLIKAKSLTGDATDTTKKTDDDIDNLVVTGKTNTKTTDVDKTDDDLDEIVITDKKDDKTKCDDGFHDDGTGLCVADTDTKEDTECPEGYIRDLETGKCVLPSDDKIVCGEGFKLSADGKSCVPIVKTNGPLKCNPGFELSADGKSCVPIKKTTPPTTKTTASTSSSKEANAPSQDPYAHIKFMEELFGGDVSPQFLTDVLGGKKSTDDNLAALMSLLRK